MGARRFPDDEPPGDDVSIVRAVVVRAITLVRRFDSVPCNSAVRAAGPECLLGYELDHGEGIRPSR